MRNLLVTLFWRLALPVPLAAHEYWIEPQAFVLPEGATLTPVVRIGEALRGQRYDLDPSRYTQVLWSGPKATQDLTGQSPGLALSATGPGLHSLGVESPFRTHTYRSEAGFRAFVREIGLEGSLNTEAASVSADGSVIETFRRFSKTLVQFGRTPGSDRRIGLDKEWVREDDGFRLYARTRPVPDQPVFLHCRSGAEGEVISTQLMTDADGTLRPDLPDAATCLLNTVLLKRRADGGWTSDWVSLYFRA